MWDKPLSIIFHQHFLHGKHFTLKVSLIAVYSVFGAEHGNLFCFGATAQLENKFSLGGLRKGAGYTMAWVTPWLWGQTQARTINKTKPQCPSCLNSHGTCCSHRAPTWDRRASEWVTIALVSASLPPCTAWSYLTGRTTTENFFSCRGENIRDVMKCVPGAFLTARWVEWFKNTSAFPLLPGSSLHEEPKPRWRGLKRLRAGNAWVSRRLVAPLKLSPCLGPGSSHLSTGQNTGLPAFPTSAAKLASFCLAPTCFRSD